MAFNGVFGQPLYAMSPHFSFLDALILRSAILPCTSLLTKNELQQWSQRSAARTVLGLTLAFGNIDFRYSHWSAVCYCY